MKKIIHKQVEFYPWHEKMPQQKCNPPGLQIKNPIIISADAEKHSQKFTTFIMC